MAKDIGELIGTMIVIIVGGIILFHLATDNEKNMRRCELFRSHDVCFQALNR